VQSLNHKTRLYAIYSGLRAITGLFYPERPL